MPAGRLLHMNEPLPILMENSIQIAWDYLEMTGKSTTRRWRASFCLIPSSTWSEKVSGGD